MDIRQQLLAAFEVEHREHIDAIRAALAGGAEGRAPDWNDIFRRAHSLKGAARAVDLPPVEALAHRLEALFERIAAGETALDREAAGATHLALDRIEAYVADHKDAPAGAGAAEVADALAALDRRLSGEAAVAAEATQAPRPSERVAPPSAPPFVPVPASEPPAERRPAAGRSPESAADGLAMLRVPAEAVEGLTRASHELASALGGEVLLGDGLARLAAEAEGMRRRSEALRGRGALPGLVRALRARGDEEALGLVESVRAEMRGLEAAAAGFAREATELSRRRLAFAASLEAAAGRVRAGAERLALVPAETVFGALGRTLRETARAQGTDVEVSLRGLDLPVERTLLQALKDPVLHALRNALSHGAEPAAAREAAGKPPMLAVSLTVAVRGGHLVVAVRDDGRGPDLDAIARTARRRGLLGPAEAPGPEALLALVFEPGFSTAAAVDTLAGRGIGLSVVADAVRALHGTVRLERGEPWGGALVMSLPLTAARRPLLLVEAGGATYALPSAAVERLLRVERGALGHAMGRPVVAPEAGAAQMAVHALADLVGGRAAPAPTDTPHLTALVLRAGPRRCVLAVEKLSDVRTLLVLPAPPIGADPALVAGTVILPGDVPVLVLDPEGLGRRCEEAGASRRAVPGAAESSGPAAGTSPEARRSTVLVVDDSITTRTLEKGILEAAGYRVVVCVDGQDALDRLGAEIELVDLVLADVEMPRLDGFGLLRALRADTRFARLPIILMTSRGDPEDVARGLDLGADAYLTKQRFDQRQLLETIGQLL